jgi:hypothetical protein
MKLEGKRSGFEPAGRRRLQVAAFSLLAALAAGGCSSSDAGVVRDGSGDPASSAGAEDGIGSLRLALVTAETARFRLRNAVFDITRAGTLVVSLSSEAADPDAEELTATLSQGRFSVTLRDGWTLERLPDDGSPAEPVRAALITPNPTDVSIRDQRETTVVYNFTTALGAVSFGRGSVDVRIGLVDPSSLASCDIVNQSGCASGQTCLMADDGGRTYCATAGTLPAGAPCSSEQCVLGAQCLEIEGAAPVCVAFCNPLAPTFGCDCQGLSFDDALGVCGPPPTGSCDLLAQSGCAEGEACQLPSGSAFGVCGQPGTLGERESCFGEVCGPGLDCLGDDPALGFAGTCFRFCDLSAPSCDFCVDVGTGSVGRCFL